MLKDNKMVLGIYGAGGLGREVFELASVINNNNKQWSEIVFIDDADAISNPRNIRVLKFSNIINEFSVSDIQICIAIGEPATRKILYDKIIANGLELTTLVHPDVVIPDSTIIGRGTVICKFLSITCDITIGKNVYIHPNVCIGHDSIIGEHTVVSSYVDVAGDCKIGSNTFLAINVCMRQGISIGDDTIIGMGSVVHRDIPNDVIAMGNPARPMKKNEEHRVFR
jgi:sugar O-acyltransferase (sialic acid O-acetyltransferase NeuD family)